MRAGNDVILQNRPPLILFGHAKVLCFAVLYRKGVRERDSKRLVFFLFYGMLFFRRGISPFRFLKKNCTVKTAFPSAREPERPREAVLKAISQSACIVQ